MSKEIKELQRIRSILSYVTGFEDDDQENIEDARKSVGRVIDSLAEQPAQQEPLAYQDTADKCRLETVPAKGGLLPQRTWVGLTDEEIDGLSREMVKCKKSVNWLSYSIEAKLKELNT